MVVESIAYDRSERIHPARDGDGWPARVMRLRERQLRVLRCLCHMHATIPNSERVVIVTHAVGHRMSPSELLPELLCVDMMPETQGWKERS